MWGDLATNIVWLFERYGIGILQLSVNDLQEG